MSKHSGTSAKKGSRSAKLVYLIIVLILLVVMLYMLNWLWKFAERYQAGSIDTLLTQASQQMSQQTGLDIGYSSVPTVEPDGSSTFNLTYNKHKVGKVRLAVKEMGPFSQAIYEIKEITGTGSFEFEAMEGIELTNTSSGQKLTSLGSENFPGTEFMADYFGAAIPQMHKYQADGIFTREQVEAQCPGYKLIYLEGEDGKLNIYKTSENADLNNTLRARAFHVAQAYSGYISTDVAWDTLASTITYGSPLLESIPSMDVQWYTTHNAIRYENIMISDPIILRDDYAMVQISFDFIVSSNWTIYAAGSDVTYPIELTEYLHLDNDGIWRVADMNMILRLPLEMTEYVR